MRVIKIGGNELDKHEFRSGLAHALRNLAETCVVVHGGGKAVDELQAQLGQETVKIQGLRKTDHEALQAALMVLCGLVSKQLVANLITAGVDAIGLSGIDGGLLRVKKFQRTEVDLGFVGEIVSVRTELLLNLLSQGITPVISPISLGLDGQIYNVNADHVASAIATALPAESLDFISNVPGVLKGQQVLHSLDRVEAESLISTGDIQSGMVPKVHAALKTSSEGIPHVRIVNLHGLSHGGGTTFSDTKTTLSPNTSYAQTEVNS